MLLVNCCYYAARRAVPPPTPPWKEAQGANTDQARRTSRMNATPAQDLPPMNQSSPRPREGRDGDALPSPEVVPQEQAVRLLRPDSTPHTLTLILTLTLPLPLTLTLTLTRLRTRACCRCWWPLCARAP